MKNHVKKLSELDNKYKIQRIVILSIYFAFAIVSLVLGIVATIQGDVYNRKMSAFGTVAIYFIPLLIELIFKKRFSFMQHIFYIIYITLSMFMGSILYMHNWIEPYDEIMHFIFGYISCLLFFYIFIAWRDYYKQNTFFMVLLLFVLSMGIASIWEVSEFTMDVFFNQNSLGYASEEILKQAEELGLTGIQLSLYKLQYGVSVWDTITDMSLHFVGSLLFIIQYLVHRFTKKTLMLQALINEYENHKKAVYHINEVL